MEILHFNLASPIYCEGGTDTDPFNYREEFGETIFCFELNETQCLNIEPDKNRLLGPLVFGGKTMEFSPMELPVGQYLFAQKRELLKRDDIIDMAVEIQAEGLWQRLKLGKRLYLRYLFEDGSAVTQLFRPLTTV